MENNRSEEEEPASIKPSKDEEESSEIEEKDKTEEPDEEVQVSDVVDSKTNPPSKIEESSEVEEKEQTEVSDNDVQPDIISEPEQVDPEKIEITTEVLESVSKNGEDSNPEETIQLTKAEDSEEDDIDEKLGKNSADPKQRILWAAEKNEVDAVRLLLEEDPMLVGACDEDLYTPLHRACSNNHVEIVKLLLSNGADLSARTEDGWCPLHCACRWDSVEAASLLLQGGADVNAISKGGLTPLHLAASNSSGRRTMELLLWHPHVDGSLRTESGDTAYDIACRTSNSLLKLFELLEESVNCF